VWAKVHRGFESRPLRFKRAALRKPWIFRGCEVRSTFLQVLVPFFSGSFTGFVRAAFSACSVNTIVASNSLSILGSIMAEIRLRLREADGELPNVCMCCGEPSTILKTKNMSWHPQWVILMLLIAWPLYLVLAIVLTKRARVQAPLCDQHKGHWFKRTMLIVGTLLLFIAVSVGAFVLANVLGDRGPGRRDSDFAGMACLLSAVLGLVWLVILAIAQHTAIRPKEITDKDITLTGLSQAFVEAVQDQDVEDRSRRGRRSRDDDDDDLPRKKRKPTVAEEDDEPVSRKKRSSSEEFEAE
jgi:hypothetical protein